MRNLQHTVTSKVDESERKNPQSEVSPPAVSGSILERSKHYRGPTGSGCRQVVAKGPKQTANATLNGRKCRKRPDQLTALVLVDLVFLHHSFCSILLYSND